MSRLSKDAGPLLIAAVKKCKIGMHQTDAIKLLQEAGYAGGAAGAISALVTAKKVKRFKDANGDVFLYTGKVEMPAGCTDFGYKMFRNRKSEQPAKKSGSIQVLVTVQYGRNKSLTLTHADAKEIHKQLSQMF